MIRGATFRSPGFREVLVRAWDASLPTLAFIGANPGLADEHGDDATARKYVGFAARWGFGSYTAGNLFQWVATDQAELFDRIRRHRPVNDPGDRDGWIAQLPPGAPICFAWGNEPPVRAVRDLWRRRVAEIERATAGRRILCAGRNDCGAPVHLSRFPYTAAPIEIRPCS